MGVRDIELPASGNAASEHPAPVFTTRRQRRAAERAALPIPATPPGTPAEGSAAPVPVAESLGVPVEWTVPDWLKSESAEPVPAHDHVAAIAVTEAGHARRRSRSRTTCRERRARIRSGQRRGRGIAKRSLSATAMLSVVGLAIGLSLPAAATFGGSVAAESAEALMTPAIAPSVGPSSAAAQAVTLEYAAPAGMHLGGAIANARVETTFAGESKAEILRARYLAAGRPFEPGFIPTTGAVRWPYPESVEVSSGFGDRHGGFHGGTDFVPGYGVPVGAIADGVVTWVGRDGTNLGYYVTIAHVIDGERVDSLYAHLIDDSSAAYELFPGLEVEVGQLIGDTGNTGFSTGPHLHLEIRLDGVRVNPYEWLTINAR